MPCEEAEECRRLGAKSATNLKADGHKSAPACPRELGVGVTPFALGSAGDGTPRLDVGSGLRLASAHCGGDKRRIDSKPRAVPQWEAICDNLHAPVINDGHIDIHVGYAHVAGHRGTSLPADASDGALKRERTRCEDAGGGAGRPVIPERVKATPASAGAQGKRQRQAQAAEQEDAEVGTGDDDGVMGRQGGEGPGRMRPRLREQERTRRRRQVSKVCLARALIARSCSDALPTPEGNFRLATRTAGRRR